MLVARPLVPSDGGPWLGEGQGFVMLWIVLAATWIVVALSRERFEFRFGWIDAAMVGLVGWWSASALLGVEHGAPRPSINMLWEGVAALAAFFTLRQLVEHPRESRALVAVMIGLGVALACSAFYQYAVKMPADQARLRTDPEGLIRENGWEPVAQDSPAFKQLADRLNSPEPLATFSLTNSLAAYLAPWLAVAVGIVAIGWPRGLNLPRRWLATAVCILPIAGALFLTHSRSAWIGTAVGAGLLAIGWLLANRANTGASTRVIRLLPLTLVIGAVVLVLAGVAILRPDLLGRAFLSFRYRLDYWLASLAMIRDHVWFGCGPGNFKEYYTFYKLPAAGEEISDPHNWLFEVAACAGLPSLAFLLALVTGFFGRLWNMQPNRGLEMATDAGTQPSRPWEEEPSGSDATTWIVGGMAAGFWLALGWTAVFGFPGDARDAMVGMLVAGATVALLFPWIQKGTLSPRLCGTGVVVLLVALLAVGGITFPGVAGTLWLLLALGLNATDPPAIRKSLPWLAGLLLLVLVGSIGFAQHQTGYRPVLECESALETSRRFAIENRQGPTPSVESAEQKKAAPSSPAKLSHAGEEASLLRAANADPWAVEPRRRLAIVYFDKWRTSEGRNRDALDDFEKWISSAEAVDPRAFEVWIEAGQGWREAFAATKRPEYAKKGLSAMRRAAELYPTNPDIQLELAQLLDLTGDRKAAAATAREAVHLDDLLPDNEKKLTADQRKLAERIGKE